MLVIIIYLFYKLKILLSITEGRKHCDQRFKEEKKKKNILELRLKMT